MTARPALFALLLFCLTGRPAGLWGQCVPPPHPLPADLDPCFGHGTGFTRNYGATDMVQQPDGKLVVSGYFSDYEGTVCSNIIRLYPNGSFDSSFATFPAFSGMGLSLDPRRIALQADGKILVAGSFTRYGQIPRRNLARLNSDGSLDTAFRVGTGFAGTASFGETVISIAVTADGKVLVTGTFTSYGDSARTQLVRLRADGSLDTQFSIGTGFKDAGHQPSIPFVEPLPNGKIIAYGAFATYRGLPCTGIARLNADGSFDPSFHVQPGFNGTVSRVLAQPDGRLTVVGSFTTYNHTSTPELARLNADGTLYARNLAGNSIGGGANQLLLQPDGKLIAIGQFYNYGHTLSIGIVRINPDFSIDSSFRADSGFGNGFGPNAVVLQPGGKLVVAGDFATYKGQPRNGIARLYATDSVPKLAAGKPAVAAQRGRLTAAPNPAAGSFSLRGLAQAATLYLTDAQGRAFGPIAVRPGQPIDLRTHPPGLYRWQAGAESGKLMVE